MTTTDNSRADALTDHLYILSANEEAMEEAIERFHGSSAGEALKCVLHAQKQIRALLVTPIEQPAATPIDPRANRGNSVGDWLWCELMDYCKERGMPPANNDRLFDLVKRARAAWDSQPAPSPADERAATFEEWFSSLSPQRRALIGDVRDVRMGWEAARAGEKS